ncbi:gamma-aminobutyric acid receptor subunit beta-like [Hydractinia symbiolongicarpus]|uniref:gamma-aminobutyric acid receptor subunit beta-like n=1 Tax=Hydractinia symbiolongicarpus TaxID=13093 RepID=UPI00254A42F1|nr:gamma-aminobutyric acid receptor subunit beta-like [Hydractinia symbiolongicarpus]
MTIFLGCPFTDPSGLCTRPITDGSLSQIRLIDGKRWRRRGQEKLQSVLIKSWMYSEFKKIISSSGIASHDDSFIFSRNSILSFEMIIYSYLNQQWTDSRLKRTNHHTVVLQDRTAVWVPDVYCLNCRKSTLNSKENRVLLRVDLQGNIYYSQAGIFHAACKFTFENFPFDEQNCKIQLSSYSYNNSYIKYRWLNEVLVKNHNLDQFLVDEKPEITSFVRNYLAGNFLPF